MEYDLVAIDVPHMPADTDTEDDLNAVDALHVNKSVEHMDAVTALPVGSADNTVQSIIRDVVGLPLATDASAVSCGTFYSKKKRINTAIEQLVVVSPHETACSNIKQNNKACAPAKRICRETRRPSRFTVSNLVYC